MSKLTFILIIVTALLGTISHASGNKCSEETQKKLLRLRTFCSGKVSHTVCSSVPKGALCEDIVQHFSDEIAVFTNRIQASLIDEDLSQEGVRKKIKKDLKSIEKLVKIIGDENEKKKIDDEIKPLYKIISKFSKKNVDFMNKVHENGLTSRQIVKQLVAEESKVRLLNAVKTAFDLYKSDIKDSSKKKDVNFKKYLYDAISTDRVLASALPIKKTDGRYVASAGLVLFGCAHTMEEMSYSGRLTDIHLLLYGKKECGFAVEEKVFGPGLYVGGGVKAAAFICLSGDQNFTGVGVTAGAGGLIAGGSTGVYVGTGICVKAEITIGALGAYAGIGYLEIDDEGVNVFKEMYNL